MNIRKKLLPLNTRVKIVRVANYDALYHKTGRILGTSWEHRITHYIVLLDEPLEHALAVTVDEEHLIEID